MYSSKLQLFASRFFSLVLVVTQVFIPIGIPLQTAWAANVVPRSQSTLADGESTPTPTFTPTAVVTATGSTITPTSTITITPTPNFTPTSTTTPLPTATPTVTTLPSPTPTLSPTPSPTAAPSSSGSPQEAYHLSLPAGGGTAAVGDTPFTLIIAADAFGEPTEAHLQVLQGEEAWSLAPHTGVAVRLAFVRAGTQEMVAPAPGKVTLQFSYRDLTLPHRYGGEFLKRLRFYEVLPGDAEPTFRMLPTHNSWNGHLLSAVLADNGSANDTTAPTAHVYIVESGPSGSDGDYSATPLTNQKDYQVSLFTGSASTSYTIPVPPAAAGPVPQVRLTYDSGRVDGMSSEKNNQPSWVGAGWELEIGAITRRMVPCGKSTLDLCLTPHYDLTLNGVSSALIPDEQTPHLYHLQDDLHWQVWQRFSDNPEHPDQRGEYWEVITPDGTNYRFGGEFEPNTGADQQSVFYTPVYDETECPSDPQHVCSQKGYRWNLDYVVDANGNAISLFYTREFNYYQSRRGRLQYVKAGYLQRIEYTKRQNGAYQPKAKIVFYTAPRCTGNCKWPDDYPDVPSDLACKQDHGCDHVVPTFWGTKRLDHIDTYVYDSSAGGSEAPWVGINHFQFKFAFSNPEGEDEGQKLILTDIIRSVSDSSLSLSPVHYDYVLLPNRVVRNDDDTPMPMPRLHKITTELGGQVVFDYSQPQTCPGDRSDVHESRYCYFTYDTSEESRWYAWWRYVVTSMAVSGGYDQPEQRFTYTYEHPMWHHQDPPRFIRRRNYQLWNDFRGHRRVTVTDGAGHSTTYIFYQGMDGDLNPDGSHWSSTITLNQDPCGLGAERPDDPGLQGRIIAIERSNLELTQRAYIQTVTARSSNYGQGNKGYDEPLIARFTAQSTECHLIQVPSGATSCPADEDTTLTTRVDYLYDAYGNRIQERYAGDVSTPDDDHILVRSFVYNPQAYIVNRVSAEGVYSGLQPPDSLMPSGALTFQEFAYDGQDVGDPPIHGNLTLRRRYISPTQTSDTLYTYDEWGRVISATDPNGAVTVTHYNPEYGYKDQVTDPLGHTVTYTYATVNNIAWGVPSAITDPNGYTTTLQYDGFGRLTAVWLPTEPVEGTPTKAFAYHPEAHPAYVETRQWIGETNGEEANAFLISRTYYDGLGREIQRRVSMDATGAHGPHYTVVSRAYDDAGHLARQSQPYPALTLNYSPPSWSQLKGYIAYTYDALGRVTSAKTYSQNTLAFQTKKTYCGRLTRFTDANGHVKEQIADAFGNLSKVREHNAGEIYTTTYIHDPIGRLTKIVDAAGNITTVQYDMLGRKIRMDDPDLGEWLYTYDPAGRLVAQRDARLQWLYFTYDALGRMTAKRKDAPDGTLLASYTYDPPGHIGALAERKAYTDRGELVVTVRNEDFDARGRVLAQAWTFTYQGEKTFRLGFQYNAANDLLAVTYPGGPAGEVGETLSYSYIAHNVNRLWEAHSPEPGEVDIGGSKYNAAGLLTSRNFTARTPSSEVTTITSKYTYEAGTNRLTRLQVFSSSNPVNDTTNTDNEDTTSTNNPTQDHPLPPPPTPTPSKVTSLLDLNYTYDAAGNIVRLYDKWPDSLACQSTSDDVQAVTNDETQRFTYDDLNRLTSASGNAECENQQVQPFDEQYAYDALGNLISRNGLSYAYSGEHPHAVSGTKSEDDGQNLYFYDNNGNMTERRLADGSREFMYYDAQNRLTAVQVLTPSGDGQWVFFRYDDQGKLVERLDRATVTFYVGDYYEYTEPRIYRVAYQEGKDGYNGTKDTTLDRDEVAHGDDANLWASRQEGEEQAGVLVDFTNLPEGIYVLEALLRLYVVNDTTSPDARLAVYMLDRDWEEGTATWGLAGVKDPWAEGGANGVRQDRGAEAIDAEVKTENSITYRWARWLVWDVTKAVRMWQSHPESQHGLKVMLTSGEGKVTFASRETVGTIPQRERYQPTLEIEYTLIPPDEVHQKRYYLVNGQPVALKEDDTLYYLFGDHLGSTSLVVSATTGKIVAEQRYLPFGGLRWRAGTLPTDRQYTGQRWDETLGLYDYRARYYDPTLARFIQPDTVVPEPGDPQSLNRYAYVLNNPLRYNDPSGHRLSECGLEGSECGGGGSSITPSPTTGSFAAVSSLPSPLLDPGPLPSSSPTPKMPEIRDDGPRIEPYKTPSPKVLVQQESREEAEGLYLLTQLTSTVETLWGSLKYLKYNKWSAARAVNPNPVLDFVLGAAEQFFDDARKPNNLTLIQRFLRPVAKGFESEATGIASDFAGGFVAGVGAAGGEAAEPAGGGVIGLPLGFVTYLGVSYTLDEAFWPQFNEEHLSLLGEWK